MLTSENLTRQMVPEATLAPEDVTLLQWNVLADELAHGNFIHAPEESLLWSSRSTRLLDAIRDSPLGGLPDIICLQEVDHYDDFFGPQLEQLGYEGRFAAKEEGRDGCCVFWKRTCFSADDVQVLRYVDAATGDPQSQLALLANLVRRDGGRLHVATTHLKAKAGFEDRRRDQVDQLLNALADVDAPLIIAGDLNDVPESQAYSALARSELGLGSAYAELNGGCEPAWTTWKIRANGEKKQTIDYVWYGRSSLRPVSHLAVPDAGLVEPARLPGWQYPSDHLCLLVHFAPC